MATVGSPFTSSGTAQRLPADQKIHERLLLRVIGTADADSVLIRVHRDELVTAAKADFILYHKEALEICGPRMNSLQDVSIIALSGTPQVYWGLA